MSEGFKEKVFWTIMSAGLFFCLLLLIYEKISTGAAVTILSLLALLAMVRWAGEPAVNVKHLSLTATLIAAAALSRIPFAALPSVQPVTFLIIVSGFVFGPQAGFMIGAMSALVSNFFLGQGPWTPWQMLGWGLAGISAALIGRVKPDAAPWTLAVFAGLWGYLFGWIQNIGLAVLFVYPLTFKGYLASCMISFPFDSFHALTNFLLCLFIARPVIKILQKYRERLEYKYVDQPHFVEMDWSPENEDKPGS